MAYESLSGYPSSSTWYNRNENWKIHITSKHLIASHKGNNIRKKIKWKQDFTRHEHDVDGQSSKQSVFKSQNHT